MLTFLVPKDLLMILERTIGQVMDDGASCGYYNFAALVASFAMNIIIRSQ
jgi:hypothetical protein